MLDEKKVYELVPDLVHRGVQEGYAKRLNEYVEEALTRMGYHPAEVDVNLSAIEWKVAETVSKMFKVKI